MERGDFQRQMEVAKFNAGTDYRSEREERERELYEAVRRHSGRSSTRSNRGPSPAPPSGAETDWAGKVIPQSRRKIIKSAAQKEVDSVSNLLRQHDRVERPGSGASKQSGHRRHFERDIRFQSIDIGGAQQLGPGGMQRNSASSWQTSYQSLQEGESAAADARPGSCGATSGRKLVQPAYATAERRIVAAPERYTQEAGVPRARARGGGATSLLSHDLLSDVVDATSRMGSRNPFRSEPTTTNTRRCGSGEIGRAIPGYTGRATVVTTPRDHDKSVGVNYNPVGPAYSGRRRF